MVDDGRYRSKLYLDTYLVANNMKEDDTVTNATTHVMYANPNAPMSLHFFGTKNLDAIFTIGHPNTVVSHGFNLKPYKYREEVPINVYSVNKTGLTAVKLLWQCELELRGIAYSYPGGTGSIRVLNRSVPADDYKGGFFLYSVETLLAYTRALSAQTTAFVSYGNGYLEDFATGIYNTTVFTATGNGAAGGTSIVNTAHTQANDYWNGRIIKMLTGTCAGEERVVTDFDAGTDTLTTAAFTAQIDAGDTYLITDWQETEDGNTTAPTITSNDWLTLTVSGSAGNAVAYYSYPSEATNHDVNLGLSTTLYTKVRWRFICTGTTRAKIVLVFTGAEGTQTVLDATSASTWTVGSATITAGKTLDHIRLYANVGTGTVVYDFIQISKGNFTFPNIVSINKAFEQRVGFNSVFGAGGDSTQGGGSHSKNFDVSCDLTVSNDNDDWKRPQGTLAGKTDYEAGQVFDEIIHECYDQDNEWQWISLEDRGAFKAIVSVTAQPSSEGESMLTLNVREYPGENANSQTEAQRFNRS